MSGSSSVPVPTFGPNGFVAPAESAILAGRTADINSAFGGGVNPDPKTPQGQIAASDAAMIGDYISQLLEVVNGIDPAYAAGRFQDAVARIYFLTRNPAQPTTVMALCRGGSGVVIPTGALAQAQDGSIFVCTAGGTIGVGGTVTLPFANQSTGPIALPPAALNQIYKSIPGWDSITNAGAGVLGNVVESRADFEARRQASVALNSRNVLESIRGQVISVPNVLDAYVTDNATNGAVTKGGVSIAANSVFVCTSGGDPNAIATAIYTKIPPGQPMTGTTTVTVTDNVNYVVPYPTYNMTFTVATATPIYFAVNMVNVSTLPADATTQIQNAIIAAFSGADGGPRARIGSLILASRFYAGITSLGNWVELLSLFVGFSSSPTSTQLTMNINQVPTITAANIAVSYA